MTPAQPRRQRRGDAVLTVMMPVYNEAATITQAVARVLARPEVAQLIVVDDCSTDGTWELLEGLAPTPRLLLRRHERNRGKGAGVRTAIPHIRARWAVIQDADLELSPEDYPALLGPLVLGTADAVFGVRRLTASGTASLVFVQGNRWLNRACNAIYHTHLHDFMCGYKVFAGELWMRLVLECEGFDIDAEITGGLLGLGMRVGEVPVTYVMRSRAEGKKVHISDGVRMLRTLLAVRRRNRRPSQSPPVPAAGTATHR